MKKLVLAAICITAAMSVMTPADAQGSRHRGGPMAAAMSGGGGGDRQRMMMMRKHRMMMMKKKHGMHQ